MGFSGYSFCMILKPLTALIAIPFILASQTDKTTSHGSISPHIGETRSVHVRQVLDGDTFVTAEGEHVRVWGINSPEKDEAGFWAAGLFLDMKVRNSELRCKAMAIDRFERTVMKCATLSGIDIGSWMVETGYARDFTRYSNGAYQAEEKSAKLQKRGLWNPESGYSPSLKYTP